MVAVAETARPLERRLGSPAEPDRERRAALGERLEDEVVDVVEAAVERARLSAPQVPPQEDRLLEVGAADREPVGHPEVGELDAIPADPDPGNDATPRQRVERRQLLGQHDGLALGNDDHARPQPQPGMPGTDVSEGEDGLEGPAVLGLGGVLDEDVVGRPHGRPADPLGNLGGRLDPLGAGAGVDGRQNEPVVHARMVSAASQRRGPASPHPP